MAARRDGALDAIAGPSTPAGTAADLGFPADVMAQMAAAENEQKKRLRAEELVSITVPRSVTVEPALYVGLNGVAYRIPILVKTKVPKSIYDLAMTRIEAAQEAEEQAQRLSEGG